MTRAPTRRPTSARPELHCPENDCGRDQARAQARIADAMEGFIIRVDEIKPHIEAIGDIIGKWVKFCAFVRKWFPKVGWWLIPLGWTLVTKGGSEGADALVQAVTAYLQSQTGGGA